MPELQRVKALSVRNRHLCQLEGGFARQTVEGTLPQTHIVIELMGSDKFTNSRMQSADCGLSQFRKLSERRNKPVIACDRSCQILQAHEHGRERTRHHGAFFIARSQPQSAAGYLIERPIPCAGYGKGSNALLAFKKFCRPYRLRRPAGTRNYHCG